jgi:hypothetical protein
MGMNMNSAPAVRFQQRQVTLGFHKWFVGKNNWIISLFGES